MAENTPSSCSRTLHADYGDGRRLTHPVSDEADVRRVWGWLGRYVPRSATWFVTEGDGR